MQQKLAFLMLFAMTFISESHNTLYTSVTVKLSFTEKLLHSIYVLPMLPGITTVPSMTLYSSFCKIL